MQKVKSYEEQYYLVDEVYDDSTLYLSALDKTASRNYEFEKLALGTEPLFFENAYKDKDKAAGKFRPVMSAHMNMTFLIISDEIRQQISDDAIYKGQFYPAVIIDDNEDHHEGYWFFNIYQGLDVLDCESSEIKRYKPENDSHKVVKYKLKKAVLDGIPEEQRLIFTMPNTNLKTIFVHRKIVDVFERLGVSNIKFYKMSEWYRGKQFES